jgi:hypothetical protein
MGTPVKDPIIIQDSDPYHEKHLTSGHQASLVEEYQRLSEVQIEEYLNDKELLFL